MRLPFGCQITYEVIKSKRLFDPTFGRLVRHKDLGLSYVGFKSLIRRQADSVSSAALRVGVRVTRPSDAPHRRRNRGKLVN
jgi:hypothetical protein